jgi:hypothetical protein
MNLERALEELFTGQKNVAKQAKELDMTTEELKIVFREYAIKRPINVNDEDVWNADTEPAWPYA